MKLRLLNRKAVRQFALDCARTRAHRFTRVSEAFLLRCEAQLKVFLTDQVRRHPSVGRTLK
jgi:hypothetical protein